MMSKTAATKHAPRWRKYFPVIGLGLVFCVAGLPLGAQQSDPGGDVQVTIPPPGSASRVDAGSAQSQQADSQPAPSQPQIQDQGAPPEQQSQSESAPPPDEQSAPQNQAPPRQNRAHAPTGKLPESLNLPAGTVIRVRADDWISSDRNVIGDDFSASLAEPIVVDGWVVARRGQAETGRVTQVKKGNHGSSQLGVEMPELTLVDGQRVQLQAELYQASGGTSPGRDAAVVGTTTGLGALIGAIAGRGVGAAIGAGVGATAGIIGVISTPGRPAVIAPETVLSFRLQQPVTISTANSEFAFKPVSPSDYDSHAPQNRPRLSRPAPPPPPPGYYRGPYGYPYAHAYPYPYGYYPGPYAEFGYYGHWR